MHVEDSPDAARTTCRLQSELPARDRGHRERSQLTDRLIDRLLVWLGD